MHIKQRIHKTNKDSLMNKDILYCDLEIYKLVQTKYLQPAEQLRWATIFGIGPSKMHTTAEQN